MAGVYLATFVLRGKNIRKMLEVLREDDKTQAELHKLTNMYRTHVLRTLNELISKKLVKCINSNDNRYKIYELTLLGKNTINEISELKR